MNRRQLLASATVATAAAVPAKSVAQRADSDKDIVGSWFATLTITNPPVGEIKAVFSFHEGGVVTATARYLVKATPVGDLLETSGHGAWRSTGPRTFEAAELLFLQSAESGAVIGTDEVRLSLSVSQDRQTLAGQVVIRGRDTAGGLMFELTGTYSATRINV